MDVLPEPALDVDLFSDEALDDPYPIYSQLRQRSAAVYLPLHGVWALPRYEEVRSALRDWQTFSSADGVCAEPEFNAYYSGLLVSDPPLHDQLRGVMAPLLTPRALAGLKVDIERRAAELVATLVGRGSFDAITDLAAPFPVSVMADLVGLPPNERDQLLPRSDHSLNLFGPDNERSRASVAALPDIFAYAGTYATRERLAVDGLGAAIYQAADEGRMEPELCLAMLLGHLFAGMDTVVGGVGNLIWLLGCNPDQWQILRQDPAMIASAFEEGLRLESPLQFLARAVRKDFTADGVTVPAGSRVLLLYGSANRDERRWDNPTVFDVRRNASGHLALGHGIHNCIGQVLARIEAGAVIGALVTQVKDFTIGEPTRHLNNSLRRLAKLPVTVTPAT